jgi:hypothetical protein
MYTLANSTESPNMIKPHGNVSLVIHGLMGAQGGSLEEPRKKGLIIPNYWDLFDLYMYNTITDFFFFCAEAG